MNAGAFFDCIGRNARYVYDVRIKNPKSNPQVLSTGFETCLFCFSYTQMMLTGGRVLQRLLLRAGGRGSAAVSSDATKAKAAASVSFKTPQTKFSKVAVLQPQRNFGSETGGQKKIPSSVDFEQFEELRRDKEVTVVDVRNPIELEEVIFPIFRFQTLLLALFPIFVRKNIFKRICISNSGRRDSWRRERSPWRS